MKIASQNLEKEDGEYRARTSRLMKWKEMVRESQKHLALPENPPERIMPGNVVLFHTPSAASEIEIGLVLSCWRGVKAPKMHASEIRIDSCSAFRAVVLNKMSDNDPSNDWFCDSKSTAWVVRTEALICILDVERCVHPRDHDGFMKVVLNDESTEALAKAHTLPRWDVSATMTRGVKGPKGIISKAKANPKGAKRKAEGTDSSAKAAKASKKPTAAQVLKEVAEAEAGAEATSSKTVPEQRFTRSQKGREAIKMKFEKLVKLDSLMFKQNPSFSLDGLCRMKYPVAEGLSMQQMSDSIASCFEG
ncbi:unnamed protein product, partial [Durusdinium trenchii]